MALVILYEERIAIHDSVVVVIDVIRSTFLRPLSFSTTTPFSLARIAQMHREKSFCLKARRRPSCLHLNCFGLNRSCERPSSPCFPPSSFSSLFVRDFARKATSNEGVKHRQIHLLSRTVIFTLQSEMYWIFNFIAYLSSFRNLYKLLMYVYTQIGQQVMITSK